MRENIDTETSSNSRQKTKVTVVTVTKSEGEGTGKDLVCLCFPRHPPALVLICLLLPFTILNIYKLGHGLACQDSAARTYMVFSGIIWLLVLPPWLALLVSHTNVSYPYQSSILDKIKRTGAFFNAHCLNVDVYACTEISWFLFHIFHILLTAICVLQVNQSIGSLPGFLVAILFDLFISGSELVHGVWQGWQRCKGETEEVALQGFSLPPARSLRIKDKYKSERR